AALLDLDGWDPKAFLKDLRRVAAERGRGLAADLRDVADRYGHRQELAIRAEDRFHNRVLRYVAAPPIRIVVQHDITRFPLIKGNLSGDIVDDDRHRSDLRRAELGAGKHLAIRKRQGTCEVEGYIENGRVGGLHQCDA